MDYYFTPKRDHPLIFDYNPPLFYSPAPRPLEPFFFDQPPFQSNRSENFYEVCLTPLKKKDIEIGLKTKNLGYNEEGLDDVIYYFKEICAFESEIEKCREELARKPDFKIIHVFNYFDRNNSHQILIPELQMGLDYLCISASTDDIYLLIKRYSKDQVEKLK